MQSTGRLETILLGALLAMLTAAFGCSSGSGLPLEGVDLGSGLVVAAAADATETPRLTVLAERTSEERGFRRAAVYGVSGRFAGVRTSTGAEVCGPGIAGLFLVELDSRRVQRAIRFGDPGAGEQSPVLTAKAIREPNEYDEDTGELLLPSRPARVIVTVSGIFAGVDAGRAGALEGDLHTGAIACLDLYNPHLANVLALEAGDEVSPVAFDEPDGAEDGLRASVSGSGPFAAAGDLLGFTRASGGDSLHAQLDLRSGEIESLDTLGAPQ